MIRICHKWHILLDTAKAAATSPVNLPTLIPDGGPDFAVVSFYKMFGAPTGLGALFVKKQCHNKRQSGMEITAENKDQTKETEVETLCLIEHSTQPRHFFGGGSVDVVLSEQDFMMPRNSHLNAWTATDQLSLDLGVLVHGTEHFRGIANLVYGFQEVKDLGGMHAVSRSCLSMYGCIISFFWSSYNISCIRF